MKKVLLIQEAGASALRLCPQSPSYENNVRFYFEINQIPNTKRIFIDLSKDVYSEKYESDMTIQDSKPEFKTIKEALEFLKNKFNQVYFYHKNEKMLRCGNTIEEILGLEQTKTIKILENDILLFISKNPKITDHELIKKFGSDSAGYVKRWAHDYGQNTTPFIVKIEDGWTITNNGLDFIRSKEASY